MIKNSRKVLFRDLDYIKEEAEREKREEEYLKEDEEAGKTQFKMNIVKGKEEELKPKTEKVGDVLWREKHQKVKVRNNKEIDMGVTKQIRKQGEKQKCCDSRPVGKSNEAHLKDRRKKSNHKPIANMRKMKRRA